MTAPTTMQIPGFRGELIGAEHADYGDARAVWNGTVDRRPRLIARCTGAADVAAAVLDGIGSSDLVALGGGRVIDTAKAIAAVRAALDKTNRAMVAKRGSLLDIPTLADEFAGFGEGVAPLAALAASSAVAIAVGLHA